MAEYGLFAQGKWRTDNSWVSYFNFSDEVMEYLNLPSYVKIHDVTLRDGEQTPNVVFRVEEKVKIAQKLDEVGVDRIEAGFPLVSDDDRKAIKLISGLGLNAKVFALSRLNKYDVDLALECDVDGVICEGSTSDVHLKFRFNMTREEIKLRVYETIDYAKSHGLYVSFMSVDSTRTDLTFLTELFRFLEKETKIDSFTITDSYCCIHPLAFMLFVRKIKSSCSKPLELHCHNEMGLAVANTLAGVGQGADTVHVSVNGLGEKTGNAPLEEVAVALKLLYGVDINIKLHKLCELSRLVEEASGVKLAGNKPVVGEEAFSRESGLVVYGWLKFPLSVQSFNPELVGNKTKIYVGKKSGKESIRYKLAQLGINLSDEQTLEKVLVDVKKTSIEKKRCLTDDELLKIVRNYIA